MFAVGKCAGMKSSPWNENVAVLAEDSVIFMYKETAQNLLKQCVLLMIK